VSSDEHFTFSTTHWSVVLAAGQGESAVAAAALEKLCHTYWYPLYAFIRRRGYGPEDAQDLTQAFLLHLFRRNPFSGLDQRKGRFRSFLLAALNYFLADQRDRALAARRGGGRQILSFDALEAEARYRLEPADERSPDKLFDRRWALTLLEQVLARLGQEFKDGGKARVFDRLRDYLVAGAGNEPYAQVAAELQMTEEAVKKAVQRLRRRYYQLFREEIAQTLANPSEVEDELRHLCAVIAD
jgi:RNA polymerase sigma factor (sigma-70 family)